MWQLRLTPRSEFVASHFAAIKAHNPALPVLVREARGAPARIFMRLGTYPSEYATDTARAARPR